ncbi:MAG: SDR family oxidoreductase [Actinobacteria bacterium]|nr:SDR family oxidoreductase [Actinomycetota bacterium]
MNSPLYLVTGASGYVGGRLVRTLLENNYRVRVLVRDKYKVIGQPWASQVEICEGNADNPKDLEQALAGVHTAYYLLHSINLGKTFDDIEATMARSFAQASEAAGVAQIVYLGGIANDKNISKHLASRASTGKELASTSVPVLELRAGIIIGSGSASFEMLRHLTHRLPVMTTPKWVSNRTHPIAIRDILYYLKNAAALKTPVGKIYDIGGPEILSYADMMQKFAKLSGLPRRWIILIPPPQEGLLSVETAMSLALSKISDHGVETRWSDASIPTAPWQKAQGDPEWAGETILRDHRQVFSEKSAEAIWKQIEGIGGEHGWFGADFLWFMRGLIDRIFGGVGLRRGRRDQDLLRVGESLDFWRVEELERGRRLKLYAEMILPGKAWLEFSIEEKNGKTLVTQEATFSPRGLGGRLYWYAVAPFHVFVFPTMLRNLVKRA